MKQRYHIQFHRPITSWDEGLPLGNGAMGCLLYGDNPIRLSVDRVDLWDCRSHPATLEQGFTYQNLVKLSTSGKPEDWAERNRLFERIYDEYAYPSKISAGRIELDFGEKPECHTARVDIQRAIGTMTFDRGSIEAFAHATRFVTVARVKGDFLLKLHIPDYICAQPDGGNAHTSMGYPETVIRQEGNLTYYIQKTFTDFSYGIFVLSVKKERYTELYITIETSEDAEDFAVLAKQKLQKAAGIGYNVLKREHINWWKNYWEKSRISIGDPMLEKTYYRSWYLFASCSRKGFYPMPLQGVWTADNDRLPPWKGDYHHDTNTQLSYQSYLKANRLDEGECFVDYLWQMKPQYEKVAREFFGVDGLLIPGVSTIDGKPMGGWSQYALSPTMSIWTAQSFDEYYLYTGDRDFLRQRAFPFLDGIATAITGLLKEKDGKLYLPLSTSPEIYDAEPEAYLKPNSNFDLALMRYLFSRLTEYCRILGIASDKYEDILRKLDPIAVVDGHIGLDAKQRLGQSHRHFSHLMCLYPLHLINFDTEAHKALYENALLEIERLGMGMWVGFSYAMCAQIYAMAEKGNAAYEKLRQFADGFVADNGFHLNGDFQHKGYSTFHYRPFTLEALFGFCDALQEMLMQEHQGYLHLFPAIPNAWKGRKIGFERLRSYGGVLVSATAFEGFLQQVTLELPEPMELRLKNTFNRTELSICSAKGNQTLLCEEDMIVLSLPAGTTTIMPIGGSRL